MEKTSSCRIDRPLGSAEARARDTFPKDSDFDRSELSRGIALLLTLLPSLGIPARATLEETHRAGKKDLPSGTALLIERELRALFQGEELLDPIVSHRVDGKPTEHRVVFEFPGEELEISHRVADRRAYALGAIEALSF